MVLDNFGGSVVRFSCIIERLVRSFSPWLLFLAAATFIQPAQAAQDYCAEIANVAGDDVLNVRSEPTHKSVTVGAIAPHADTVIVHASKETAGQSTWVPVTFNSDGSEEIVEGYVNAKYLKRDTVQACTAQKLYELGVSLNGYDRDDLRVTMRDHVPPHPNKCSEGPSVSNAMLRYFESKGFTLKTLCLALTTSRMQIDPETSSAATLARVKAFSSYYEALILNPPDCFKNGTPVLDCRIHFHWYWGYWGEGNEREGEYGNVIVTPSRQQLKQERDSWRAKGEFIDTAVKKVIAGGHANAGVVDHDTFASWTDADTAYEIYQPFQPTLVEYIVIDESLPRGYAYRLTSMTSAGDAVEVDLGNLAEDLKGRTADSDLSSAVPWLAETE